MAIVHGNAASYFWQGVHADRPTPTNVAPNTVCRAYETDTQTWWTWMGAAWAAEGGDVEAGSTNVTITAGTAEGSAEQTFATGHTVAPIVVTGTADGGYIPSADTITTTTFRAVLTAPTPVVTDVTALVSWLARVAT